MTVNHPQQGRTLFDQGTVPTTHDAFTKDESTSVAVQKQKCFFCGDQHHLRHRYLARSAECNDCGKTAHFAKVCLSTSARSKGPNISAALLPEHYIASTVGSPACLQSAAVDIELQGLWHRTDKPEVVKKIGLASFAKALSVLNCNISAGSHSLKLGIVDNLCADMILGLHFLKMHRSTIFVTGGCSKADPSSRRKCVQRGRCKSKSVFHPWKRSSSCNFTFALGQMFLIGASPRPGAAF